MHGDRLQKDAETTVDEIEFTQVGISRFRFRWDEIAAVDFVDIDVTPVFLQQLQILVAEKFFDS